MATLIALIVVGVLLLLATGPAAGSWVYETVKKRYRNADQSHDFEHATSVVTKPVTGSANKVEEVKGLKDKRIQGENMHEHRKRL